MAGFDLKPESTSYSRDVNNWTHSRDSIPLLMEGRVSLSQWQSTFDAVKRVYTDIIAKQTELMEGLRPWIYIPCCMCFVMGKMSTMQNLAIEQQAAWTAICKSEQEKYRQAGIQVSLAKELSSHGVGSNRHMENEVVGLHFEVVVAAATTTGGAPIAATMSGHHNTEDVAGQISKLNDLYKDGVLSRIEFDTAKAKLLNAM